MERLQRVLAHAGVASRRSAEEMIRAGRVTVNGKVVTEMGVKVDPTRSTIRVDGAPLRRQQQRYILLNKPRGFITTTSDERDRWTVLDLVQVKQRIYPVGRLDRDTEGLLLLTNDGELANRVMHPRYDLAKEYHVLTTERPTDAALQRLREGISLDGKTIVPDDVRLLREDQTGIWIRVVIHEGMTHAVRRMMDAVGIPVERLRRVRIGPLVISGIPRGAWRDVTSGELASLIEALKLDRPQLDQPSTNRPAKKLHVQRPQPRHRPITDQPEATDPDATTPTRKPDRSAFIAHPPRRPTQEPGDTPTSRSSETVVPNTDSRKSRRRRGEPPTPLPKRKYQNKRRDRQQSTQQFTSTRTKQTGPRHNQPHDTLPHPKSVSADGSTGNQTFAPTRSRSRRSSEQEQHDGKRESSGQHIRQKSTRRAGKSVPRRHRD